MWPEFIQVKAFLSLLKRRKIIILFSSLVLFGIFMIFYMLTPKKVRYRYEVIYDMTKITNPPPYLSLGYIIPSISIPAFISLYSSQLVESLSRFNLGSIIIKETTNPSDAKFLSIIFTTEDTSAIDSILNTIEKSLKNTYHGKVIDSLIKSLTLSEINILEGKRAKIEYYKKISEKELTPLNFLLEEELGEVNKKLQVLKIFYDSFKLMSLFAVKKDIIYYSKGMKTIITFFILSIVGGIGFAALVEFLLNKR